jgi:UDP-2-acetamido-3-amino-2,3-dideoxy-glucuronate N-acetyltransferase
LFFSGGDVVRVRCDNEDQKHPSNICPVRIAVIGSGYWGRNLVRNYKDLGVLKLICDKNETLLAQFRAQNPDVDTCLAINDVLSREDIQAVVIATPAETHFVLAREALLAGKHVFVEKPLVLNETEAEELIALAEQSRLVLMVGHLLQYHPVFVKLRELAAGGELGRINYIYSHRLNLGKIRREENILWSFAPHDISMILTIAGELPESVLATGGNYLHQRIADVTTTHLEFPSGLKAHIFVSWLHPFKDQKLVVVGDRKMAVFDDTKPWLDKLLLYAHEIRWEKNMPVPARAEPDRLDIQQAEPLRLECEHFLDCIKMGKRPQTDGNEGLAVLKILNAGQRSLNENGMKVCIDSKLAGRKEVHPVDRSTFSNEPFTSATHGSPPRPRHSISPHAGGPDGRQYFVHPSSIVDDRVVIGVGTKIWHFSHILSDSVIGERCSIGQNVVIGPGVAVGDGCKIQNNVSVYRGVTLEEEVFCGPSVVFTNVFNPRSSIRRMDELRPTLVKKGASLGANSTIVCGNTIGRYAFVGAGTVVTRDVPDHALVVGNPARQMGWMCECGTKLDENFICPACNMKVTVVADRAVTVAKD